MTRINVERERAANGNAFYKLNGSMGLNAGMTLERLPDHFTIIYDDDPQGKQDEPETRYTSGLYNPVAVLKRLYALEQADKAKTERIAALEGKFNDHIAWASTHTHPIDTQTLEGMDNAHEFLRRCYEKHLLLYHAQAPAEVADSEPPAPAEPTVDLDALLPKVYDAVGHHLMGLPYEMLTRELYNVIKEASRE